MPSVHAEEVAAEPMAMRQGQMLLVRPRQRAAALSIIVCRAAAPSAG